MVMTNKDAAEWQKQLDNLQTSTLKEVFLKHKCTKGILSYDEIYDADFKKLRNKPINILEIGVDQGRSIAVWLDYFPNAKIYAIDIFVRKHESHIESLQDNRVQYLKIDSTDPDVYNQVAQWKTKFDIVIDDGKHTPEANALTFKNIIPFLKPNGIYYIEDIFPIDQVTRPELKNLGFGIKKFLKRHFRKTNNEFTQDKWKIFTNALKGYKIEKFDHRKKSNVLNSYIYKITK